MRIIAGDVGGTKTLLQIVDVQGTRRDVAVERRYESESFPTFDAMLREFLALHHAPIDCGCFAVAGPVLDGRAGVTNLGWDIVATALEGSFSLPRVVLINDFYAVALGVPLLQPADLVSLNKGRRVPAAPIGILGAGTGLGEAALTFDGGRWNVLPSEGGHADFAPQDALQAELFLSLHVRYGHVSWERVLSGAGLENIYSFLRDHKYAAKSPSRDGTDDAENLPARISEWAAAGDALASEAFEIFVDIYGAEAGNMAIRFLARGGIFLAGGIAGKNIARFTDGRFRAAFLRKGRFRDLLEDVPVDLITNAEVGLLGAVEMAARAAG